MARLIGAGPLMCVLWFGARQVIEGRLTAGELSAFVVYAIFVSGNVGTLAGVFSSLIQARAGTASFHDMPGKCEQKGVGISTLHHNGVL